jgi:hypothetical protein
MGIRFACHVCQRRLNIKRELAGRRGICPVCAARIRIPLSDAEWSTPVDETQSGRASHPRRVRASGDVAPMESGENRSPDQRASAGVATDSEWASDRGDTDFAAGASQATWYVRPPSGGQYGPATTELLRQWIEEGRVSATALLWREGWPQWRDAREALPEYADRLPDSGSAGQAVAAETRDPNLAEVHRSPRTSASVGAQAEAGPRPRWTRTAMTVGLLSVLALSLILVLAFAVSR